MDEMEDKLGAILGNPQLMQQIMTMAQSLGQSQPQPQPSMPVQSQPPLPEVSRPAFNMNGLGMDPAMLQRILGIARQSGIDKNQQALLRALSPYIGTDRIQKLERAMRAAKIANAATSVLRSSGIPLFSGR